jgi:hypothetical protein
MQVIQLWKHNLGLCSTIHVGLLKFRQHPKFSTKQIVWQSKENNIKAFTNTQTTCIIKLQTLIRIELHDPSNCNKGWVTKNPFCRWITQHQRYTIIYTADIKGTYYTKRIVQCHNGFNSSHFLGGTNVSSESSITGLYPRLPTELRNNLGPMTLVLRCYSTSLN